MSYIMESSLNRPFTHSLATHLFITDEFPLSQEAVRMTVMCVKVRESEANKSVLLKPPLLCLDMFSHFITTATLPLSLINYCT